MNGLRTSGLAAAVAVVAGGTWLGLGAGGGVGDPGGDAGGDVDGGGEFCAAYGILVEPSDDRISHGGQVILDHSGRARDGCGDDDLWHYGELGEIDGVLFDDCVVSWVGGGRTSADELGLDCRRG